MPRTLVRTNAPPSRIDRSTWDSAAALAVSLTVWHRGLATHEMTGS
ncbi:hypothetical protein [Nocardiopsis halotolerans]|nr:hypothetical protein [Nocardiopsis halotolerans]